MLVPLVLAVIMLVGCKEPVGLPNDKAHTATSQTIYCYPWNRLQDKWTGHIDAYSGYMKIDSSFDSITPTIRWGEYQYQNRPWPRRIGYVIFRVPAFDASQGVPACTLYYYQSAHSGYPNLEVRWFAPNPASPPRESTFYQAWDSDVIMATDNTHNQAGWYKVALTSAGMNKVVDAGSGQQDCQLWTGWVYPNTCTSDIWTEAYGCTSGYEPYIKVVTQ